MGKKLFWLLPIFRQPILKLNSVDVIQTYAIDKVCTLGLAKAGQVRKLVRKSVNPQLQTNEKVADMRTCGLWRFKLRTCGCGLFLILVRNFASFIQILKFLSIFVKYLCFYPVKY